MRKLNRHYAAIIIFACVTLTLTGCNKTYPPASECTLISEAEFNLAKAAGTPTAVLKMDSARFTSQTPWGKFSQKCDTPIPFAQICKPNSNLLIEFEIKGQNKKFVRILKDQKYRYDLKHKPIPCSTYQD